MGPKIRTHARYREKASLLPGGLKPGLGPLRGRVLKDMTWKKSFKTSRAGLPARPSPRFNAPGTTRSLSPMPHNLHRGCYLTYRKLGRPYLNQLVPYPGRISKPNH